MLEITPAIRLQENALNFKFVRASGPGGQNVNKVASAVELRFDMNRDYSLPAEVRSRLARMAANRINSHGQLVIFAQRFRSQERNRADAIARLVALIRRAAVSPIPRKPTKASAASRRRRLEGKRRVSSKKRLRSRRYED
ncbi:MAG: aminoacyl-tRNA hydrolase [Gammaproteobacteria bacterium]|nr:aminoacyl-tRNA hydrolase [Gammaproteobacteria bacterium]MDE2346759.1 aminoacyl-tRNA hydrolase [Gammaproteobacteria bacterium]